MLINEYIAIASEISEEFGNTLLSGMNFLIYEFKLLQDKYYKINNSGI